MGESNVDTAFLKEKYDLHNSPEVAAAAKRTQVRTGESVPNNPAARIENYLHRFAEIVDRTDSEKRERGIEALKRILYNKFVIKPDNISEAYWENQKRLLRERGQEADLEQVDWNVIKAQNAEAIVTDQQSSLDNWVNYLASDDAAYPDWLKYWSMRSVLSLAKYDKEKKIFPKRSEGTTNPFPELNREALAYILDAVEKKRKQERINLPGLAGEDKATLDKLLQGESFSKLYAWAIEKVTPASVEQLMITEGKWVKYRQNSDHMPLVTSLQGHGTGWCTAGESTAAIQLRNGDFYVYYSFDQTGKPTIPRAAIRMEGDRIGEVRGVAVEQNLDPHIGTVVQSKLREFPDGMAYEKKVADMKMLTAIEKRIRSHEILTRSDLVFLYEMNTPIEGFGYQRDPRIEELRKTRNFRKDAPVVFGCTPEQIAHTPNEIRSDTRAYDGKLTPGIFEQLPVSVEYIYTAFPEGKIHRDTVTIGTENPKNLQEKLKKSGVHVSSLAESMLKSIGFTTQNQAETVDLVRLRVQDLGLKGYPTTDEIYQCADELGLDLCPAEVGPQYRLKMMDQPMGDWFYIGMKQIAGADGNPSVFEVERDSSGLWLDGDGRGRRIPGIPRTGSCSVLAS